MNLKTIFSIGLVLLSFTQITHAQEAADPFAVIYGKELPELRQSRAFKASKKVTTVQRHSPILMYSDRMRTYQRTKWTYRPSKLKFVVYATFQDQDDGGNTLGWIENIDRKVVATISDSYISAYQSPALLFPEFLKDRQVPELREDPAFSFVVESVVTRLGALPYLQESEKQYQVIRLTHIESQTAVILYATFRDEDDGGNTLGWVEDLQGRLIAVIGDSYFNAIP